MSLFISKFFLRVLPSLSMTSLQKRLLYSDGGSSSRSSVQWEDSFAKFLQKARMSPIREYRLFDPLIFSDIPSREVVMSKNESILISFSWKRISPRLLLDAVLTRWISLRVSYCEYLLLLAYFLPTFCLFFAYFLPTFCLLFAYFPPTSAYSLPTLTQQNNSVWNHQIPRT